MATSYPDRTNARGIWSIDEITKNIKTEGTWPGAFGNRALFGGGSTPSASDVIDYITLSSTGDAADFGDLTVARQGMASMSSTTRGIWAGGADPDVNTIDYVTMASTGDAADFGDDQNTGQWKGGSCSNGVRGVWGGGNLGGGNRTDVISYVLLATTSDRIDFGDLTATRFGMNIGMVCSNTRGVMGGGAEPGHVDKIEYITINTEGNSVDFGDLSQSRNYLGGASSNTKGVFAGGSVSSESDIVDSVNIASTGDAVNFGDLSAARNFCAGTSNYQRAVFGGGGEPTIVNTINYFTISTAGDAVDFGDLSVARTATGACSSAHGGLEVFDPTTRQWTCLIFYSILYL